MLAQFGRSRATLRRSVVHALRFLTSAQPNSFRTYATIPSSEDQPALKAGSRSFKRDREIRSLDPAQLRPSDFVDFSDMKKPGLWIQGVLTRLEYWPATTLRNRLKSSDVVANHDGRFPAGTRGFLYYHSPPLGPASGGQLRLRITDSADPSAFARGYDLRTPHELPWCLPLPKLVGMHNGNQLARVLVQQGLVSQAAVDGCSTRTYRWRMPVAATTSLSQLFYYDFSSTRISFRIIHGEEQPKLVFLSPRLDPRRDACTIWPWTGASNGVNRAHEAAGSISCVLRSRSLSPGADYRAKGDYAPRHPCGTYHRPSDTHHSGL